MSVDAHPLRWRGRLAALGASLLLCLTSPALPEAAKAEKVFPIRFGGPFELIDHRGETRTNADFAGRFMLIYFVFTNCPHNLQVMTEALERLGDIGTQIQPLFITSDLARNTAELLREYVENFHPSLVGLTGSEAQIRTAAKSYRVHRSKLVSRDATDANDYLVNHTSLTYLMGPDGNFVTLFPQDTTPEFMATTIKKYLAQD